MAEEFFELFKTPWERFEVGREYDVVITTREDLPEVKANLLVVYGANERVLDSELSIPRGDLQPSGLVRTCGRLMPVYCGLREFERGSPVISKPGIIRAGYDLFSEVEFLLSKGQPVQYAHIPTLDFHIAALRTWILGAGLALLEIPPSPADCNFSVSLTHDIDFVGIRPHFFDHSMWGFVYRATLGSALKFLRGGLNLKQLCKNWRAVASLPFVYAGWARDFWEPFDWYLEAERGLSSTYFIIPWKQRAGDKVPGAHPSWRATGYDVSDIQDQIGVLQQSGCEIGVHGIDAWHSEIRGRSELLRVALTSGESETGIRMHWLLADENTPAVLEKSGYAYDSTCGYNEAVGFRAGTSQVFRPLNASKLLEMPLHIQDGALFYPKRQGLSDEEAYKQCAAVIEHAEQSGGVLTVLWHDRSHAPERFWGGFYLRLLETVKSRKPWFATARNVVRWFRKRREVRFEHLGDSSSRVRVRHDGGEIYPPLTLRSYQASGDGKFVDVTWDGVSPVETSADNTIGAFDLSLSE